MNTVYSYNVQIRRALLDRVAFMLFFDEIDKTAHETVVEHLRAADMSKDTSILSALLKIGNATDSAGKSYRKLSNRLRDYMEELKEES